MDRSFASAELFSAAPDPSTLASIAVLMLLRGPGRWLLLPIPLLWSIFSGLTYLAMEIPAGLFTAVLALMAVFVLLIPRFNRA